MFNLFKSGEVTPEVASLVIGSDLRAGAVNAAWRRLGLPGGDSHELAATLFPKSEVAACALAVLTSGAPSENVLIRLEGDARERFLLATFLPSPSAAKRKRVIMQVWEVKPHTLFDAVTGDILQTYADSREVAAPMRTPEQRRSALAWAVRNGSHYLGRFPHRLADGRVVELEAVLAVVEPD